jgi:hypothetical protein
MKPLAFACLVWGIALAEKGQTQPTNPSAEGTSNQTTSLPAKPADPSPLHIAEFDENPFDFELSVQLLAQLLGRNCRVSKQAIKNPHNPAQTDTLVSVQGGSTKLEVYKTPGNETLFAASINRADIPLRNRIRVGMTRDEFLAKFYELRAYGRQEGRLLVEAPEAMTAYHLDVRPHQITISNDAATAQYQFSFVQNRLRQIKIDFYLD